MSTTHASRAAADYGTCEFCERSSILKSRNICNMHYARERRGIPRHAPVRQVHSSHLERLLTAALAYASAESEADHRSAKQRVIQSAIIYVRAKSRPVEAA